jgi:hypothetical protein
MVSLSGAVVLKVEKQKKEKGRIQKKRVKKGERQAGMLPRAPADGCTRPLPHEFQFSLFFFLAIPVSQKKTKEKKWT